MDLSGGNGEEVLGEDDEVRGQADRERPLLRLGVLGEGRVAGEVPERRLDGEPLRRLPAPGRRALDGREGACA